MEWCENVLQLGLTNRIAMASTKGITARFENLVTLQFLLGLRW